MAFRNVSIHEQFSVVLFLSNEAQKKDLFFRDSLIHFKYHSNINLSLFSFYFNPISVNTKFPSFLNEKAKYKTHRLHCRVVSGSVYSPRIPHCRYCLTHTLHIHFICRCCTKHYGNDQASSDPILTMTPFVKLIRLIYLKFNWFRAMLWATFEMN